MKGRWVHQDTTLFSYGGGKTVQDIASKYNDEEFLLRIRDKDLFACEARYHPACRKSYTSDPALWLSNNEENKQNQAAMEFCLKNAIESVL